MLIADSLMLLVASAERLAAGCSAALLLQIGCPSMTAASPRSLPRSAPPSSDSHHELALSDSILVMLLLASLESSTRSTASAIASAADDIPAIQTPRRSSTGLSRRNLATDANTRGMALDALIGCALVDSMLSAARSCKLFLGSQDCKACKQVVGSCQRDQWQEAKGYNDWDQSNSCARGKMV